MSDEHKHEKLRRLGPYKVLRELGHGGMARVFCAEDTRSGDTVAVKVLMPELTAQPAFVKRFHREVETLKALEHPAIVAVLDVGQEGIHHYYVMEYMDGDNLERIMHQSRPLSVNEALKFTRVVAGALDFAHNQGIIHRDIKPANIMTDSAGNIKLTDFGIAKDLEATRLTVTGSIVGTADYMSPEQAEGKRVTRKSDVYSLGVCLYEMLTGKVPFVGATYLDVIRAHRYSLPEPPKLVNPAIPGRVARLVEQMMEKDPNKRPASGAEVIAQIDSIQNVGGRLSEEEIETARDFVHLAMLPAADWRVLLLKIVGVAALVVAGAFAVWGMKYRYFTTASYKLSRGEAAFRKGEFEKASKYFGHVVYFHPDTDESAQAEERLAEIRYASARKAAEGRRQPEKPDMLEDYNKAIALLDAGQRQEALELLELLSEKFADTEGGGLAAAKLAELSGNPPEQAPSPGS